MSQLHKKFTDAQVKELLQRYLREESERKYVQEILLISKRRFFNLIKQYRENPEGFSIQYNRRAKTRSISRSIEENIIKELTIEKKLIEDKSVPLRSYNYSYIKDLLEKKYNQKVSLPTIIDRAKKNDFYLKKPKWYLVTSLDDFSRFVLYPTLLKKETSWAHILALETVILHYGSPYSYYVDSHRIFRFVQSSDSFWRRHHKLHPSRNRS